MATLPEVHRTVVDGVPVFWVDTPGRRLTARLLFGVGLADETLLTTGISHVIEHLTMRQVGEHPYAANASVGTFVTEFEVSSSPEVVTEHLAKVCRSLAELDLEPLDVERSVIRVEERHRDRGANPVVAWPLSMRYGARGPGLIASPHIAPSRADPTEVADWCRQWFHRANAALVLTGPLPDGLRLPMPDGEPVRRAPPTPLDWSAPGWREIEGGVIVAMFGPRSVALTTGVHVLERRLTKLLRQKLGVVYELSTATTAIPENQLAIGLGSDVENGEVDRMSAAVLYALDALCADGPNAEELAFVRAGFAEDVGSDDFVLYAAYDEAAAWLRGEVSGSAEHVSLLAGDVEAAEVAAAMTAARSTLILGLAEGHRARSLPELPHSPVPEVRGTAFRRRAFAFPARGSRLVLGAEGVTFVAGKAGGPTVTIRFADVVGVSTEPGPEGDGDELLGLRSGAGDSIPIRARDWRGGQAVVDAVRAHVPASLFFPAPEALRFFDAEDQE
ncbi:insulinase family protein [Tenggerimyces flavus]|uniref:Insulinase family protein n=1 Tax=Tenggerimyces flavus TaxID=1708749 RepID=A0ABV7Y5C8_9ACTN|nr:insulinase family protein [Tenggerimyces flavus]MBM7790511.1 hypothetical protein [Tenggerimyces flavus]